jgi:hypothetical protein
MEVDGGVDARAGQAMCVEEGEEAELELVLRDVAADVAGRDERAEGGGPLAGRVPRDEVGEGGGAREPLDLGLGHGALEVVGRDDGGEVQEGAGGGGHGDAVVGGDLVGLQAGLVDFEAGPRRSAFGTLISTAVRSFRRMPQRAAAERWESTAPSATRTAAIQVASLVRGRCPTA